MKGFAEVLSRVPKRCQSLSLASHSNGSSRPTFWDDVKGDEKDHGPHRIPKVAPREKTKLLKLVLAYKEIKAKMSDHAVLMIR